MSTLTTHRFLHLDPAPADTKDASAIATYVINHCTNQNHSTNTYRQQRTITIPWTEYQGKEQTPIHHTPTITYRDLVDHLKQHRTLDPRTFGLPTIQSNWLDSSIGFAKDTPFPNHDGTYFMHSYLGTSYGERFPFQPGIDREGIAFNSLQRTIQTHVTSNYHDLITGPTHPLDLDGNWLWTFRSLINDAVSLVDITLHQLWAKAEYDPEPTWKFNPKALGSRHGQRLLDKLSWINKITGKPLNAQKELPDFITIKNLRNHLAHFDPPIFACTLEDITTWLNLLPSIGRLLWKIRERCSTQLNDGIIELLLLPPVRFTPKDPNAPRIPQPTTSGYPSTNPHSVVLLPPEGIIVSNKPTTFP